MVEDDPFDRPPSAGGISHLTNKLYEVRQAVAVMTAKFEGLTEKVEKGFVEVNSTFRDFNAKYVTREEYENLKGEVKDIRKNLSRGAWIVIGAVFTALVTGLFKTGIIHT